MSNKDQVQTSTIPKFRGYYGHSDGCDCAVCEDINHREWSKQMCWQLRDGSAGETLSLKEIKKWRKESTAEAASMTFISRVDRLIEMADAADTVVEAWQKFCDSHPVHSGGFEDHRALYNLAEIIKHGGPQGTNIPENTDSDD